MIREADRQPGNRDGVGNPDRGSANRRMPSRNTARRVATE